jgi:YegS/Rv2252/BmrU family lipid kinase
MKTRTACLIFNPVAGKGNADAELRTIFQLLSPQIKLDIRYTQPDVSATELAKAAIADGVDLVIASGGDGTISAAAKALVHTEIPLGIIPRGTANAFAAALGISDKIPEACDAILNGVTRVIDAASCNDQPTILLTGMGWEAEAVENADREAKNWFGFLAYVLSGFEKLWDMHSFHAQIEIEGEVTEIKALAVTIANAAPPSSVLAQGPAGVLVDDGKLDVTIISTANEIGALQAVSSLMGGALLGTAADREDIVYLRAKDIKITATPPQKVAIDGELKDEIPCLNFRCLPLALQVVVPQV